MFSKPKFSMIMANSMKTWIYELMDNELCGPFHLHLEYIQLVTFVDYIFIWMYAIKFSA